MTRFRKMIIVVLMSAVFPGALSADNGKITDISIRGNVSRESSSIMPMLKSKVGEPFSDDKVNEDVKTIYKLGLFEDVKAETTQIPNGVSLVFKVVEKPYVKEIRVSGNKEINTDKIIGAIELKPDKVFSGNDLSKAEKKIKKLYNDDGYYFAEVTSATTKVGKNGVRVTFTVKEGQKILIKTIRFEGNTVFSARKLRKQMETKEKWFLSWITGAGTYKEDVLKNDVNRIADLYYNNGYINVKVGEPQVKLMDDKSGLMVTFAIIEGEQFMTGSIDFKGELLVTKEELDSKVLLKKGEVFNRELLRRTVGDLTDLYGDQGYAFANINPISKVDQENKTVSITFDFEKGEKVYIERINISGNTRTRDKVVRREFRLAEGDQYSTTALKKTKQNLQNLGYFDEVSIAPAKGSAPNKLNLNTEIKEKHTAQFSIGAGYSSSDGIIGQGSVQENNFLGLGLKGTLQASLGGKTQYYNIGVTDPYFLDSNWSLGFDVYRTEKDYNDYKRRVTGADIKAGYKLSDQLSTFWMYKYEVKRLYDLSYLFMLNRTLLGETSGTVSSIYGSISYDNTDYRLDPSKGYTGTLSAEYAGLGGNQKFTRFIGESAVFFPLKWSTVISLRGTLGYIMKNGSRDVPIDEKFYLGGINTLRGYNARTVCPVVNGVYVGGVKENVFNVDYVFPIIKDAGLKGVVFFDMGNSYASNQEYFSNMLMSYGAGLRWNSPMGPLRLEYGFPLNPRTGIDKKSGRFEFSIGGFF